MEAPAPSSGIAAEALAGLTAEPKTLPAKLFYDEAGCRLFLAITELPEYYLTRTERALLQTHAQEIAALIPEGVTFVEFGAGNEEKALLLLDALAGVARPVRCYLPIDIAEAALCALADRLKRSRPELAVLPQTADFLRPHPLPPEAKGPFFGFFPGSTIGNLEPEPAVAFLRGVREAFGAGQLFLIGFDLRKQEEVLLAAYNDSAGLTAAFNRNLLARLNREAGANFMIDCFAHRAIWNAAESRIEMHLVSLIAQKVQIAGREILFRAGETIHTENCYKYTLAGFTALAERAGWEIFRFWTDPDAMFALALLRNGPA
ncbi:MAG: L-histidine N(alpha)-methyltransferase [Acidobacteriia bacterium]|nr:L-histidine N(alpha)-methyltransferase [Methyloceanibacter sp.]MCL6492198.1 L-histidine N(alpha)-methyltransferase [Terriglobia bacterium]